MKNLQIEVDENELIVITIDTKGETWQSGSGKNRMVASTGGNVPVQVGDEMVYIGLNAYKRPN